MTDQEQDLRDMFAAMALQGMLAAGDDDGVEAEIYARAAYAYADAMLKERTK